MEDKLRAEVPRAVKLTKPGLIDVRLVSGDHLNTAIDFAVQAKIIRPNELESCMTGDEFKKAIGNYNIDDNGHFKLESPALFEELITKRKLRVIARATPEHKQLLA